MEFIFTKKAKLVFSIFILIGIVAMVVGFSEDHNRFWANFLVNGFFFFGISLGALFFLALQYVTEASYMVVLKRVMEGISQYIYVGSAIIVIFLLAGTFHWHHIYHWMNPDVVDPNSAHFDEVIAGKSAFLNLPFFWIRNIIYFTGYCFFVNYFRKQSLKEDQIGGTEIHFKNMSYAAGFLVFFAITSTTVAWDWIMSIDTHWFSTLFGWYVFSGIWVSFMIFFVLITLWLKNKGYLPHVNKSHIHDAGKWMFAISFLWTYLWFAQFLLIWYADLPEEVGYFITRINDFRWLFFGIFFVNFLFPMVILMARDSKRQIGYLIFVGCLIFIGHWFDAYMLVIPGSIGHLHIGFSEIGMFLGFLGLFLFIVFRSFAKAPMTVENHPFLEESKHLHI